MSLHNLIAVKQEGALQVYLGSSCIYIVTLILRKFWKVNYTVNILKESCDQSYEINLFLLSEMSLRRRWKGLGIK
jgi:hypothetical protein